MRLSKRVNHTPADPKYAIFYGCLKFRHVVIFALMSLFAHDVYADGGAVLAEKVNGNYRITLFGSPAPLRAGPADISVFIQDAKTGEPVLDPTVTMQFTTTNATTTEAWMPPCCTMKPNVLPVAATHASAQNKLLYAANVVIPSAGPHQIAVRIGDESSPALSAQVDVAAPLPPASTYWAYLAFPPIAIVGFTLNQRLRRRHVS